jgi:hypothetical protein
MSNSRQWWYDAIYGRDSNGCYPDLEVSTWLVKELIARNSLVELDAMPVDQLISKIQEFTGANEQKTKEALS